MMQFSPPPDRRGIAFRTTHAIKAARLARQEESIIPPQDMQVDALHEQMRKDAESGDWDAVVGCGRKAITLLGISNPDLLPATRPGDLLQEIDRAQHVNAKGVILLYADALESRSANPLPQEAMKLRKLAFALGHDDPSLCLHLAVSMGRILRLEMQLNNSEHLKSDDTPILLESRALAENALHFVGLSFRNIRGGAINATVKDKEAAGTALKAAARIYLASGKGAQNIQADNGRLFFETALDCGYAGTSLFGFARDRRSTINEANFIVSAGQLSRQERRSLSDFLKLASDASQGLGNSGKARKLRTAAHIIQTGQIQKIEFGEQTSDPKVATEPVQKPQRIKHENTRTIASPTDSWIDERRHYLQANEFNLRVDRFARKSIAPSEFADRVTDLWVDVGLLSQSMQRGHFCETSSQRCVHYLIHRLHGIWDRVTDPAGVIELFFLQREIDLVCARTTKEIEAHARRGSQTELESLGASFEGLFPGRQNDFTQEINRIDAAAKVVYGYYKL